LELAREIHAEVQRTAADPDADLDDLQRALDEWPAELRADAVLAAFRELPRSERWDVLAELFDDDELRAALAAEHQRVAADVARTRRHLELAAVVHERRTLDTRILVAGDEVVLGLFRSVDVHNALALGPASSVCARRLVLRATGADGACLVIDDTFNPERGLFVTAEYDEAVWRTERLEPHSQVRVGALTDAFEPVVYPGGRLDVETADGARRGRLHTGYATAGAVSLFTDAPS
jgi:hypothetical protein